MVTKRKILCTHLFVRIYKLHFIILSTHSIGFVIYMHSNTKRLGTDKRKLHKHCSAFSYSNGFNLEAEYELEKLHDENIEFVKQTLHRVSQVGVFRRQTWNIKAIT